MIAPDNQQERLGDYLAGIRRRGVVRSRADLIRSVIPFFERHPILSEKRLEFETFAEIVKAMECGEHLQRSGFERLVALALKMNGDGRYRRTDWSSRILRGHTPDT